VNVHDDGKETVTFDYESMYSELLSNGVIIADDPSYPVEETDEEILFKFKSKELDRLEKSIKPKPAKVNKDGRGRGCFSVKNLRRQTGIKSIKKSDIPIEKQEDYKQITSLIGKENISLYNKINDGFLTELSVKNNSSIDTFKEEIKDGNYTIKGYVFSLGEETWKDYLDYIKNYVKENL
jgi:hypothetical protein